MRVTALFVLILSRVTAFSVVQHPLKHGLRPLYMASIDQEVPLIVNGQNIELTEALIEYVNKRIGGPLSKLSGGGSVTECDVILSVNKNPKVSSSSEQWKSGERNSDGHNRRLFACRSRTVTVLKLSPT